MARETLDKKTWMRLRTDLNNSYDYSDSWDKVISLFEQRINDFYFNPIEKIIRIEKGEIRKGEGFSVMTLICALIEMFAAFRTGKIYTHNLSQKEEQLSYEYEDSELCYEEFLHNESIFENIFYRFEKNGNKRTSQPFSADRFYANVRCALMHEARTKNNWNLTANLKKVPSKTIFIRRIGDQIFVHRTTFRDRLKDFFVDVYLPELKANDDNGRRLRRFLARKLDHLHDIAPDKSEWWQDV